MASEIAMRYADGLFQLARETDSIASTREEAQSLLTVLTQTPELTEFFNAVKITGPQKKELIQQTFHGHVSENLIHLMELLVDKRRIRWLTEILQAYIHLANQHDGIEEAVVWSVRPLAEADLARIRESLQAKTGKKIQLQNRLDSRLIAGIKVGYGNAVTDVTVRHQIDSLKETLLKGEQA